ncbi:Voltage-gated potassium channel subunit beta-2 [Papilio machaon]|uniref:Voltage-gated potassium channel subunit beta-2 n=1 Tax=Papilio machaon TaxID=76193 RepID=A0A194QV47_PAPMA|nr:Voltage-gated potassium channel subunit beta-2 [Papilio machaon]
MTRYMASHSLANLPSAVTAGLRYRNLGKSGLRVPNIGLGLWSSIDEDSSEAIVTAALENGINLFDLSEAHNAKGEAELGRILKKNNVRRTSVIIITKIYWSTNSDERGLSRRHIIESVKASLGRLQTEYIDVVLLHKADPVCPMSELVRAMNHVINQGWVMYWGTARWSPSEVNHYYILNNCVIVVMGPREMPIPMKLMAVVLAQIMEAYTNCKHANCITPIVEQTEYNMFCRDKPELHMPELYHKIGVGMMVWSAITTGSRVGRDDCAGLFAKSRFNRKSSTFSWCEENLALTEHTAMGGAEGREPSGEAPRTYGEKLRALHDLADTLSACMHAPIYIYILIPH